MTDAQFHDAVAAGGVHFNAGDYFEAHEVWEDFWVESTGADNALLQGLIQMAVALKKVKERNPNGTRRLLMKAHRRLANVADGHRGLSVGAWRASIETLQVVAQNWDGQTDFDLSGVPVF